MNRPCLYHLLVLLILLPACAQAQGGASSPEPKRVLLLYYYGPENPERTAYEEGFRAGLRSFGPGGVEFYSETLETYRLPGGDHDEVMRDYLRRKYSATRLDAVAAVADSALEFALRYRDELFPGVPIVYSAAARPKPDPRQAGVTGLWQGPKMRATVELALQVHPETKQVYVISGKLNNNGLLEAAARAQLKGLEQRASINFLTDLPINELVDRVGNLPEKSVVFILRQAIGAEGRSIAPGEATALIARAANAPVYAGVDTWIGDGVVGGEVASQGRNAFELAQLAFRVATGTRPEEIPPREIPGVKMFNWRELKRWSISEDQLPPGSVVRFKEFTFWELYKWRVVGVLALCAVEALLILALLLQRARRARAEESRRLSEEKFAKAFRSSPDAMVIARRSDGTIIDVNDRWESMLGHAREEAVGRTAFDLDVYVEPRDRQKFITLFERSGFVHDFETDLRDKAGAVRQVVMSAETITINDEPCLLVIVRDVTELTKSERALRDLTGRLIRLQDEERRRIAAELHDSLGQSLAIIKHRAAICRRDILDVERASEQLEEISDTTASAIEEVREIAHNLRPYELDRLGLAEAIESMIGKISDATALRFSSDIDRLDGLLTPEAETSIYRIVQEGLNNVIRHAGATEACVQLKRRAEDVLVTVRDNGRGVRAHAASAVNGNERNGGGGFGLAGIAERARMLGAEYELDSAPDRGTTLTVRLKLNGQSHE